jgi:isoleucyl-tRNA synthetase
MEKRCVMSDYKNTLNLPQTAFPMKANLAEREPHILQQWAHLNLYHQLREFSKGKAKFILPDGPPYANGHIHLGHAVNKTLKDIVLRAKTFSGYDAPFIPIWDCHGLPIEINVEKKIGKPGYKVSAAEFRAACRVYAQSQIDIQRQEFKRLGVIADWDHPYATMDFSFEANIIRSLGKVIAQGHLQKGYKPVYWCLDCASALAEAEVEYADKNSPSIDVRFGVVNNTEFLAHFSGVNATSLPTSVIIWTTTPWTLPANQAVALNPELDYVLIEVDGQERWLVMEAALATLMQRYQREQVKTLGRVKGAQLAGILLQHPFFDRHVPIVLGAHVTTDSGTGAVHTAPAHGVEDYAMGQQYGLPLDNPVGDDGCFIASTPLFAGLHVNKANDKVIEVLIESGALVHREVIRHSYPHCWRHKTPLIFRATPQWFINLEQNHLRKMALQAVERVEWIPDWGKMRIKLMIENRPDWCISRQRTWGVPITLFLHKETGKLHPQTLVLLEKIAAQVEQQGVEAWYALEPTTLLGDEGKHYQKCVDILDVWFDSGVVHECVLRTSSVLQFPADLYLEGSDQHRGWFQSSLLTSVAMNGVESFKTVLTHGFVVDGEGRKMSKSLGNVIAPEEVMKTLGADILRLWVASVDYRAELNASKEMLQPTSEAYRRIRNTARFLLANLHDFTPEQHLVATDDLLSLDRWVLDKARRMQEEILAAYDAYEFHVISQKLHHFCVVDLGGFYLDVIKDRQYTMAKESRGRRSAQTALFHILHALVRWMSPILCFTAEEVWQAIPGKKSASVSLNTWYDALPSLPSNTLMNATFWETVRAVRDAVNKEMESQRQAGHIGSGLEAEVYLYAEPTLKAQLDALQSELRFVFITSVTGVLAAEYASVDESVATDIAGLRIKVVSTQYVKCERCWHRCEDIGKDNRYPSLCLRCVENVAGPGEKREFA